MRQRLLLLALTGAAGLAAGLAYDSPALGDLVPTLTLPTLPTTPITLPTVPTTPPLPPPPPLPPAPPVPPSPPVPPAPPGSTLPVTLPTGPPVGGGGHAGAPPHAVGQPGFDAPQRRAGASRVHATRTRFHTRGTRRG